MEEDLQPALHQTALYQPSVHRWAIPVGATALLVMLFATAVYLYINGLPEPSGLPDKIPKSSTQFGMIYSAATCPISPREFNGALPPPDISKIESLPSLAERIARYGQYAALGDDHFWAAEPSIGYYCIDSSSAGRATARAHAQQLRDAGIDFVIIGASSLNLASSTTASRWPDGCVGHTTTNLLTGATNFDYCKGLGGDERADSVIETIKVLLQEWSAVPGAPKIAVHIPLSRYFAPEEVLMHGGDVRIPSGWRLLMDDLYESVLKENPHADMLFRINGKPVLFSNTTPRYPEDKQEIAKWEGLGFTVQKLWPQVPNESELAQEDPYLQRILGTGKPTRFATYPDAMKAFMSSQFSGLAGAPALAQSDTLETYIGKVKTYLALPATPVESARRALEKAARLAQSFYWHSVDVASVWDFSAPCENSRAFKESGGTIACDQRLSGNGKVISLVAGYGWPDLQNKTGIPSFGGNTFRRQFDTLEKHADTVEFAIVRAWQQPAKWALCRGNFSGATLPGFPDFTLGSISGFAAKDDRRAQIAAAYSGQPIQMWDMPTDIACQTFTKGTGVLKHEWVRSGDTLLYPTFPESFIGDMTTNFEPTVGEHGADLYNLMRSKILEFKTAHPL